MLILLSMLINSCAKQRRGTVGNNAQWRDWYAGLTDHNQQCIDAWAKIRSQSTRPINNNSNNNQLQRHAARRQAIAGSTPAAARSSHGSRARLMMIRDISDSRPGSGRRSTDHAPAPNQHIYHRAYRTQSTPQCKRKPSLCNAMQFERSRMQRQQLHA